METNITHLVGVFEDGHVAEGENFAFGVGGRLAFENVVDETIYRVNVAHQGEQRAMELAVAVGICRLIVLEAYTSEVGKHAIKVADGDDAVVGRAWGCFSVLRCCISL